jgi:hypothetical protein
MAVELHIEGRLLPRLPSPGFEFSDSPAIDELYRWARFLAQGEQGSVSRQRSIEALLEIVDNNRDALYAARLCGLRALRRGLGTRDVIDLIQAALDSGEI